MIDGFLVFEIINTTDKRYIYIIDFCAVDIFYYVLKIEFSVIIIFKINHRI